MIEFQRIKWKNFLGTGNVYTEIELNNHKKTLIMGLNGTGKSTILDAIYFALFGKGFRKVTKDQLINNINQSNTKVELQFKKGKTFYKIVRGIKPNKFDIYKDDSLIDKSSSVDQQEFLETFLLHIDKKAFSQLIMLGSSSFISFMKLPPKDKRDMIEEILNLNVFTTMFNTQKEELNKLKTEYEKFKQLKIRIKDKIKLHNQFIEKIEKDNEDEIYQLKEDILKKQKEIEPIYTEIDIFKKQIINIKKVKEKLTELLGLQVKYQYQQTDLSKDIRVEEKSIKFYNSENKCEVCGQVIEENFKNNKIAESINNIDIVKKKSNVLQEKENELKIEAGKLSIEYEDLKEIEQKLNKKIQSIEYIKMDIEYQQKNLIKLETKSETTEIYEKLNKLKGILKEMEAKELDYDEQLYIKKEIYSLLQKGLFKQVALEKYLAMLNQFINYYLNKTEIKYKLEFNKFMEIEILNTGCEKLNYNSFSEGEKKRVDIAVLFAFRNIIEIKNNMVSNLLVIDEVLDSALDKEGIDNFFMLVESVLAVSNINLFIISHIKDDDILGKFNNILEFKTERGFNMLKK